MDEFITKAEALSAICRDCDKTHPEQRELCPNKFTGCTAYYNVFDIPASDVVVRKRGKWAKQQKDFDLCGVEYFACSQCGFECQLTYNFCPYCGADMQTEECDY